MWFLQHCTFSKIGARGDRLISSSIYSFTHCDWAPSVSCVLLEALGAGRWMSQTTAYARPSSAYADITLGWRLDVDAESVIDQSWPFRWKSVCSPWLRQTWFRVRHSWFLISSPSERKLRFFNKLQDTNRKDAGAIHQLRDSGKFPSHPQPSPWFTHNECVVRAEGKVSKGTQKNCHLWSQNLKIFSLEECFNPHKRNTSSIRRQLPWRV